MKDIKNAEYRNALVERFLDCDTTVEEERMLARFYHQCRLQGKVPPAEREVCEIVLATVSAAREKKLGNLRFAMQHRMIAMLAAAVIIAACVMTFMLGLHHRDGNRMTAAADTASVQNARHDMGRNDARAPIVASSSAQVSVQAEDVPVETEVKAISSNCRPTSKQHAMDRRKAVVDVKAVYDIAVAALHDASAIQVERKGDAALVSATWSDGSNRRFVADLSNDDSNLLLIEI